MKKTVFILFTAIMLVSLFVGGVPLAMAQDGPQSGSVTAETMDVIAPADGSAELDRPIRIAALKGPTAMGMVKLMDESANHETGNSYEFTLAGAPDELTGRIIQGEFDIAAVPINLAATLYNKTGGKVSLAALNTMGVLYIVEKGDTIHAFSDLKGKTVFATGKGAVPEFSFQYLLAQNGLADQVEMVYKSEHTELATLLAAGQAEIALLPQPFVTTVLVQNKELRVALDLNEEWTKAAEDGSGMVTGGIIVQREFVDNHPEAFRSFLTEYENSIDFVTDPVNAEAAANLIVDFGIIAKAEIAQKAIPECNIVFISGESMKNIADGFLKVLYDANPQSVGGQLPDEGFYYFE